MDIYGRVVVITGAASGIGAAMARRFAAEGARALVLGDIQMAPLRALAEELARTYGKAGLEVVAQACDVTQEEPIQALAAAAHDPPIMS